MRQCSIFHKKVLSRLQDIYSTAKLAADFMLKSLASQEDIEYINVIGVSP